MTAARSTASRKAAEAAIGVRPINGFIGAEIEGADLAAFVGAGGEHDDGNRRTGGAQAFDHCKAVDLARHLDVGQNQVDADLAALQQSHRLVAAGRLQDAIAALAQVASDHQPHQHVVLDDEYGLGGRHAAGTTVAERHA